MFNNGAINYNNVTYHDNVHYNAIITGCIIC